MLSEVDSWDTLTDKINYFLKQELLLEDEETFRDYILQLVNPEEGVCEQDEEEDKETFSIITEFLSIASSEAEGKTDEIQQFVRQLLDKAKQLHRNQKGNNVEELDFSVSAVEERLAKLKVDPSLQALMCETRNALKQTYSRQERQDRERLLARYGYELEETVETKDGETEIVTKSRDSVADKSGPSLSMSNADIAKEKLRQQKLEQQARHAKEKARNKELQEKQKLEKELKKKGTQKREKVRG